MMNFTQTQKLLMYGLMKHKMNKDERRGAFILLRTEKTQQMMINFLLDNPNATEFEILEKALKITEL